MAYQHDKLHHISLRRNLITLFILIIGSAALFISACSSDETYNPVNGGGGGGGGNITDTIYYSNVAPIFQNNCSGGSCHIGNATPPLSLFLDTYQHILDGSSNGPVVIAGDAANSEMYKRITGVSTPRMPFGMAPLSNATIDTIKRWIDDGLKQ